MINASEISEAAQRLCHGGLVAFPTETVYGLGADATQDAAVARIFAAKQRPQFNPLIAHVADTDAALALGKFDEQAEMLARAFWPGPFTIVVERRSNCPVSLLVSAGLNSLALRVPNHPVALALLREVDRPIAAPSANRSGRISPTTAAHVKRSLGDAVDMILDGGPCAVGVESTVVQFLEGSVTLLRPGGVAREEIENLIGTTMDEPRAGAAFHAPGQLESHYATDAPLRLNAHQPANDEIYIGFGAHQFGSHTLSAKGDMLEAAANLFRVLHDVDVLRPIGIAVAPIPHHGLGEAINDRLRRAAAPRDIS